MVDNSVSAEERCFQFIVKKGHSTQYAKEFLYSKKLSVLGNMTPAQCVKELLRRKEIKTEEEGWVAVRGALQKIFR